MIVVMLKRATKAYPAVSEGLYWYSIVPSAVPLLMIKLIFEVLLIVNDMGEFVRPEG